MLCPMAGMAPVSIPASYSRENPVPTTEEHYFDYVMKFLSFERQRLTKGKDALPDSVTTKAPAVSTSSVLTTQHSISSKHIPHAVCLLPYKDALYRAIACYCGRPGPDSDSRGK